MNLLKRIKSEFACYTKFEKILYISIITFVLIISIISNDNKIALISALCGITYTMFAGKGKVYCYYIGIIGTFCYCFLAYKNGFYANLALYGLYFLPMQIIGIFNWKKHLNKEKNEIIKEKLNKNQRIIYLFVYIILTVLLYNIFAVFEKNAFVDCFATAGSILGQYLTLKRCIEQWFIWFAVNLTTFLMWFFAYINNSNCLATVIMWFLYIMLAIYFYFKWEKDIKLLK